VNARNSRKCPNENVDLANILIRIFAAVLSLLTDIFMMMVIAFGLIAPSGLWSMDYSSIRVSLIQLFLFFFKENYIGLLESRI